MRYTDNKTKISFALSYLKEGTAGPWKLAYMKECNNVPKQTWNEFEADFRKYFDKANKQLDAYHKLKLLKQRTNGKGTAEEYVMAFKILHSRTGITDNRSTINDFMRGLNNPLLERILTMETVPDTIEGWYEKAIHFDTSYRFAQDVKKMHRGFSAAPPRAPRREPDVVPMDIDAIRADQQQPRRSTGNERERKLKEGKCLIAGCESTQHRAYQHPGVRHSSDGRFQPRNQQRSN